MQAQDLYLERLVMIHPDDVGSMPMSSLITLCHHFADERPWKVREAKRDLLCSLVTYLHSLHLPLHICCSSWWPQPSRRCLFMNELALTWETKANAWQMQKVHFSKLRCKDAPCSIWKKCIKSWQQMSKDNHFSALPLVMVPAGCPCDGLWWLCSSYLPTVLEFHGGSDCKFKRENTKESTTYPWLVLPVYFSTSLSPE